MQSGHIFEENEAYKNAEWNYNEKKVNILITFQFYQLLFFFLDKFVDGAQPEVAGEIVGRRHILRTLRCPKPIFYTIDFLAQ